MAPHQTRLACVVVAVFLGRRAGAFVLGPGSRAREDARDDCLANGISGRCDCCCQTECTCLRGRGIESFALPAGSEKPGACGDSGPADGAETPPSSPGDGDSSDGAAHAAATSVLVGLVAAFAV